MFTKNLSQAHTLIEEAKVVSHHCMKWIAEYIHSVKAIILAESRH